ncbi:MAG: hypothetical protein PHV11_10060 [Candidatus Bipolaricaulis sp.]|nr:hypothetical protein [Candidatus Bipolaricaulis sp.]
MTDEEQNLLIRLDERSANTYKLVEKIEKHMSEMNGTVAQSCSDIQRIKDDLYGNGTPGLCKIVDKNTSRIQKIIYVLIVIGTGGGITAGVIELIKNLAS